LTQSSLPECKGNDIKNPLKKFLKTKKWTNCHGTFLDLKGVTVYSGEFYKGDSHGYGTFNYAGRKYVGQWKNGKQHGQGTYTYVNGDKYVGEWKKGKYYGKGIYTYANGDKYVGEWKKTKYKAKNIVIATGSVPTSLPGIKIDEKNTYYGITWIWKNNFSIRISTVAKSKVA